MQGEYLDINVRWRREYPPTRSEYSVITFSRNHSGIWKDCLAVEDTNLEIIFQRNTDPIPPTFILSTSGSRVVVGVTSVTEVTPSKTAQNLGLMIMERRGGIVHELKEGAERLVW